MDRVPSGDIHLLVLVNAQSFEERVERGQRAEDVHWRQSVRVGQVEDALEMANRAIDVSAVARKAQDLEPVEAVLELDSGHQ